MASRLFGPECYIGGWSACEHWSLTDQLFLTTVVVTTRRVRSSDTEIQGFSYRVKEGTGKPALRHQGGLARTFPAYRFRPLSDRGGFAL